MMDAGEIEKWRTDGKIEALLYIVDWCRSHASLTFYTEAYRAAFDDIRVHAEASIARLREGGAMEATTPLGDMER